MEFHQLLLFIKEQNLDKNVPDWTFYWQISEHTPDDHPDKQYLQEAFAKAEEFCRQVFFRHKIKHLKVVFSKKKI